MKRLRPSRANFVDAFRCNDVLKRRTKKWGGKFIITMEKKTTCLSVFYIQAMRKTLEIALK